MNKIFKIKFKKKKTKQSVKTGIGMLFNWIPIISALPGGGFKMLFYKGSEKIVNKQHLTDTIESDVLEDYKVTKAFLLYLGHPANNDELYSRWVSLSFYFVIIII